jgi:hypothetical protein
MQIVYFEGSVHFLYLRSFRAMCNCALIQRKLQSVHGEKIYGGNVELMAISEIYEELLVYISYPNARSINRRLLRLVKLRLKEMYFCRLGVG